MMVEVVKVSFHGIRYTLNRVHAGQATILWQHGWVKLKRKASKLKWNYTKLNLYRLETYV